MKRRHEAWCLQRHFQQNFEFKKMFHKDFQGSRRFSEKVQCKAVYHRLTPSEINAGKVKLCKFVFFFSAFLSRRSWK